MMYALINDKSGVIRSMHHSRRDCDARRIYLNDLGEHCITVEVPQMMLDEFGQKLLEEAGHDLPD